MNPAHHTHESNSRELIQLVHFAELKPDTFQPQEDPLYICEKIQTDSETSSHANELFKVEFTDDEHDDDEIMKEARLAINTDMEQKKKYANKKRRFRENLSAEERGRRKERAAYLARVRRSNLSPEQKLKARQADRERAKLKRANETPSQRANRLAKDAERKRQRRQELDQFKKLLEELETAKRTRDLSSQ